MYVFNQKQVGVCLKSYAIFLLGGGVGRRISCLISCRSGLTHRNSSVSEIPRLIALLSNMILVLESKQVSDSEFENK